MRKSLIILLLSVLVLSGCVHHSPYTSEYYFQAMGDEGELVVTLDAESIKDSSLDVESNVILDRSERISVPQ